MSFVDVTVLGLVGAFVCRRVVVFCYGVVAWISETRLDSPQGLAGECKSRAQLAGSDTSKHFGQAKTNPWLPRGASSGRNPGSDCLSTH